VLLCSREGAALGLTKAECTHGRRRRRVRGRSCECSIQHTRHRGKKGDMGSSSFKVFGIRCRWPPVLAAGLLHPPTPAPPPHTPPAFAHQHIFTRPPAHPPTYLWAPGWTRHSLPRARPSCPQTSSCCSATATTSNSGPTPATFRRRPQSATAAAARRRGRATAGCWCALAAALRGTAAQTASKKQQRGPRPRAAACGTTARASSATQPSAASCAAGQRTPPCA
jgi:hypothetical protein